MDFPGRVSEWAADDAERSSDVDELVLSGGNAEVAQASVVANDQGIAGKNRLLRWIDGGHPASGYGIEFLQEVSGDTVCHRAGAASRHVNSRERPGFKIHSRHEVVTADTAARAFGR